MSKADERNAAARLEAEAVWKSRRTRDAEMLSAREKERRADAEKTARLKELRLAKETADREAAAQRAAAQRPAPKSRKVKVKT